MRKYTKLPLDLAKEIREFADSQLQPTSSLNRRARFTMPAGTEFNIDTRVASATVQPSLHIGNITTGSDSLKRSQARYWDNMGRYLDPLRNIYFDRELHLRLDIRSEFSTTSASTTLPGSYPRLGHGIDLINSNISTRTTYINRGTETIDGVTYYTISVLLFGVGFSNEPEVRSLSYEPSNVMNPLFAWPPTTGSTERRYGATYRLRTLNEVSVSHSPADTLRNPSSKVLRGTLNHAASNRIFSTRNGYYCGIVNFTDTALASQFFNVINYPPIYFSTSTMAPPTVSTVPIQQGILLPTPKRIDLQITLVSGASTLNLITGHSFSPGRKFSDYIQHISYSSLTTEQKAAYGDRLVLHNLTTLSRGRSIQISRSSPFPLMFLVPTAETATSSVIEIRQI